MALTEYFAWVIYDILKPLISFEHQLAMMFFETNKNYVLVGA